MSKVKYIIEVDEDDINDFIERGIVRAEVARNAKLMYESDDCVSRQSVIDIVKKEWHPIEVIKSMPSVLSKREQGGWISVKDRLPEESGLYLILCREENTLHDTIEFNPYLDMYYPNSNPTSWERWSNDCYDKSKVIAWMSIPRYEEVSE